MRSRYGSNPTHSDQSGTTRPTKVCLGQSVPIADLLPFPLDRGVNNLQATPSGAMRASMKAVKANQSRPGKPLLLLCVESNSRDARCYRKSRADGKLGQ